MVSIVARAPFAGSKEKVRLRLVEDGDGKRLILPDGRHIAGVSDVKINVDPRQFTTMSVVIMEFDVDMQCPLQGQAQDG
ncbi:MULTISPECIES: hypothetical protein [unclassified Caballeronia]|uniref:hypothetical protein n=1 Tax=unclassified Caballeronia TaxID=2646786 RepID=UPI00285B62AC|nr:MULTISPECIES: hypothetical protein [unclassified Caballeronia]MDR5774907.1 hypothetical protein [Caballeronia sp. LZ002]MDR5801200.1 hypothetical protein [Caballeronia sp. LZ001]MDR5850343.1 hypothetical protein [Caballeronia sp. LZ003]